MAACGHDPYSKLDETVNYSQSRTTEFVIYKSLNMYFTLLMPSCSTILPQSVYFAKQVL